MNHTLANDALNLVRTEIDCVRELNDRNVAVRKAAMPKGRGVFARRHFVPGEVVVVGLVESIENQRTNYTIQLFWDVHANFEEPAIVINHSCGPNVAISPNRYGAYDFVAVEDIPVGEEVCFDYATTEYESIAVPECSCGSELCRKKSGGYSCLNDTHRLKRASFVAPYLTDPTTRAIAQDIQSKVVITGHMQERVMPSVGLSPVINSNRHNAVVSSTNSIQ